MHFTVGPGFFLNGALLHRFYQNQISPVALTILLTIMIPLFTTVKSPVEEFNFEAVFLKRLVYLSSFYD